MVSSTPNLPRELHERHTATRAPPRNTYVQSPALAAAWMSHSVNTKQLTPPTSAQESGVAADSTISLDHIDLVSRTRAKISTAERVERSESLTRAWSTFSTREASSYSAFPSLSTCTPKQFNTMNHHPHPCRPECTVCENRHLGFFCNTARTCLGPRCRKQP